MTCANHPELEATAFCRECGKPMCAECQRPALGSIYCLQHVPAAAASAFYAPPAPAYSAPVAPPPPPHAPFPLSPYSSGLPSSAGLPPVRTVGRGPSPALAFVLGFAFPGVGAIYNGQYAKGLVHAVVFGVLVSVLSASHHSSLEPLLGIFLGIWVFYMAFEAFHTANKRRHGVPVDEFSSIVDLKPAPGRFPIGAIILIGLGFILLLDTTDIIQFQQLKRFWPLGLIVFGVYLLYNRMNPAATMVYPPPPPPVPPAASGLNSEVRQ